MLGGFSLENNYDDLREKGMLVLLAVSPIIIGFFYWVMTALPVIGKIWIYAAPFTVLYFWGWVGTVFFTRVKKAWKAILLGNCVVLLLFIIFCFQVFLPEMNKVAIFAQITQLATIPFLAITMWLQLPLEGKMDMEVVSNTTLICTQAVGVVLLIVAFSVGYFYSKRKEQKEALAEEQQEDELEDIEPIFSDKIEEDDSSSSAT